MGRVSGSGMCQGVTGPSDVVCLTGLSVLIHSPLLVRGFYEFGTRAVSNNCEMIISQHVLNSNYAYI